MMRVCGQASWTAVLCCLFFLLVSGDVVDWKEAENFKIIPNCDFYKANPGSCNTQSHDTPCRYCRVKTYRGMSSADCPGPESFSWEDQGKKIWVLKPVAKVGKIRKTYMCAVENAGPGDGGELQPGYESMYGAGGPQGASSDILGLSGTAWIVIFGVFFLLVVVSVLLCVLMRGNSDEDEY